MMRMRGLGPWLFFLMALLGTAPAAACEPPFDPWILPVPALSLPGEVPPRLPALHLEPVSGGPGGQADACVGFVPAYFSAEPDAENLGLYYMGEVLSSAGQRPFILTGGYENGQFHLPYRVQDGKLLLYFMRDGAAPLDLKIRITAYRRSGLKGESRDFVLTGPPKP